MLLPTVWNATDRQGVWGVSSKKKACRVTLIVLIIMTCVYIHLP